MSKILAQGMITLTQLYEGVQVILSPTAVLIPCDSEENPKPNAYINASTNVKAFLGTMDITSGLTLGELEYSDSTVRASKTGTKVSITTITTRTGYVDIPVSATINGETIDLGKHRFNFVKQIDGQPGIPGDPGFGYTLNIKGGVRGVAYAANGTNPEPKTSSQFSVELLKNGVKVANPASISWTCGGNLSGSSSAATFTPTIKSTYNSESSYVKVSVKEFAASLAVEETIPIICTKHADGLDWINEWNNQYVQVGTEKIITPKIFAGTKSSENELTGVAIGRDVLGGNANKVIGIVGYKKNTPVFSLDQDANFFVSSSGSAGDVKNGTNNAKGLYFDGNDLYISGRVRINGGSTIGENNTSVEEVINNSNLGAQANNKIDNLSIGGRNLMPDSAPKTTGGGWAGTPGTKTLVSDISGPFGQVLKATYSATGASGGVYKNPKAKLTVGKTYSWSVWLKASKAMTMDIGLEQGGVRRYNITTSWQKITHTFTAVDEPRWAFVMYVNGTTVNSGDYYLFHSIMVEEGNKPSDWSPAPEDIDSAINDKANVADVYKKTETYSKTQTESAIEVAKNEINLGVSSTYETKTNVESKINTAVNNVQIGGRNIIGKDINNISKWSLNYPERFSISNVEYDNTLIYKTTGSGWETAISNGIAVIPNKEYVLSFEYEVFNEYSYLSGETFRLEVLSERVVGNSSKNKAIAFHTIEKVATPRKRVYITFTPTTSTIYLMINGGYITDGLQNLKFSFNKFKLEKGNKATDWTPAPEDITADLNNKANSSDVYKKSETYTKSEADSKIKVAKDEINLNVSNTYETKTNVETKVNNAVNSIQVGGRNLFLNSGFTKGVNYWYRHNCSDLQAVADSSALSGYAVKFTSTGGGIYQRKGGASNNPTNYPNGSVMTVSGYVKSSVAGKVLRPNFENGGTNTFKNITCTNADTWYYFTHTHKIASNNFSTITFYGDSGADYYLKDVMFEYGNKASTWTPAPEDVAANIDTAKAEAINSANSTLTTTIANYYTKEQTNSQINIAKEAINLGVSNTYETKANVESKVNNAVSGLKVGGNNLLRNGNFAYDMANWSIHDMNSGGTAKSVTIWTGGSWVPSGKKAITIRGTNTTDRYGVISSTMKLTPNTKYTISGYCAGHRVNKIQVNVRDAQNGQANIHTINIDPARGGDTLDKWHRFETTFTTTANSEFALNLYSINLADDGFVWFTDVQVQEGTKATAWIPCSEDINSSINSKANSIDVYTKGETDSKIKVAKDEINLNVSSTYETKTNVENKITSVNNSLTGKINDIQVGGRNLLRNSQNYSNWLGENGTTVSTIDNSNEPTKILQVTTNGGASGHVKINVSNYIRGKEYILSFYAKNISGDKTIKFEPHGGPVYSVTSTSEWVQYKVKVIPNQNWSSTAPYFYFNNKNNTSVFQIKNVKLEEGNKATDWTPAPEDVAANINAAKNEAINSANGTLTTTIANYYTKAQTDSQINVAKEAINLGVSNTYETKSNVETKVNNAVNNIQIGGRNLIRKADLAQNSSTATYDGTTNTWTINATTGNGGGWGCGLVVKNKNALVPYGKSYVLSFEIKVPRACSWNCDVNNYALTGSSWAGNDNDNVPKRTTSSKSLVANQWIKCWIKWENTNPNNTNKVDIYDNSNFGVVMKDETSNMTYQIRNVKGELGNMPTEWTPAPEDVDSAINSKANSNDVYKKTEVYTRDETNSQINVAKNDITLAVSNTYETKTNVENKVNNAVNNIKVGGRNLILNSALNGDKHWTGAITIDTSKKYENCNSLKFEGSRSSYSSSTPAKAGDVFTISLKSFVGTSGGNLPLIIFEEYKDNTTNRINYQETTVSSTLNSWQTYTKTWTVKNSQTTNVRVRIYNRTNSYNFWVSQPKLERGTKATDWTPAPEDVDSAINNKANSSEVYTKTETDSKINVAKDNITSSVSQNYLSKNDATNTYATKSSLTQTANNITASFKSSGGYNLVKNSIFKNGLNGWYIDNIDTAGTSKSITYWTDSNQYILPDTNAVVIKGTNLTGRYGIGQTIKIKRGQKYTVSALSASHRGKTIRITVRNGNGGGHLLNVVSTNLASAGKNINNWNKMEGVFTAPTDSDTINLCLYMDGSANDGYVWFTQLMINEGDTKQPWSSHPDEIYGGVTTIDKDGITVTASNVKSKTSMSANGFKITKTDTNEDVFKVNSDGTLVIKGNITVTGGSIPTSNLSGTISSSQLNSSITNDINTAKNTANTVNTTVNNNKNNWSNAYERVKQWASGAITGSTTINGGMIEANTIVAEKIAIGDFTNYAQLNEATASKLGFIKESNEAGGAWLRKNGMARDIFISDTHTCNGGESFRIKLDISTTIKGNSSNGGTDSTYRGTAIGLYCYNGTGASVGIVYSTRYSNTTVNGSSSYVTIPASTRKFRVFIQTDSYGNFSGDLKVRNVQVTKMANGELIVDGSIKTSMIHSDGLNASIIKAGHISADRLDANTIVSKVNGGTTEINGNRIQTGTLSASKITTGTLDASKATITNLNASNITTGTINSDRLNVSTLVSKINSGSTTISGDKIRTGTISSTKGGSYIDLSNGKMALGGTSKFYWDGTNLKIGNDKLVFNGSTLTVTGNITGSTITGGTLKSTNGDMRFDMNNGYMYLYNNGTKIAQTNKNSINGTNIYGVSNCAEYGSYACLSARTSSNASTYQMMLTATGGDLSGTNFKKGITLGYTLHSNEWDFQLGRTTQLRWRQNGSNHDSFITDGSDGMLRLFGDNGMYLGYRSGSDNKFVIAIRENGSHTYPKSLSVFDDGVRPATDNNGYSLEISAPLNMKGQSINQCSNIKTLGLEFIEPIAFNRDGEGKTRTLKVTKSTQNIVEFIGSAAIKNGEAIVDLPNDVSFKNYVVLLTPIGLDRKVSIVEKNDDNFKIVGNDGIVDYVIKFESMDYASYISKSISEDNTDIIVRSEEDKPKEIFLEN